MNKEVSSFECDLSKHTLFPTMMKPGEYYELIQIYSTQSILLISVQCLTKGIMNLSTTLQPMYTRKSNCYNVSMQTAETHHDKSFISTATTTAGKNICINQIA